MRCWSPCAARFAFPALKPPQAFTGPQPQPLDAALGAEAAAQIAVACDRWRGIAPEGASPSGSTPGGASEGARARNNPNPDPIHDPGAPAWLLAVRGDGGGVEARPMGAWAATVHQGFEDVLLAIADPGHLPGNAGWPLRNLLLLATARWGLRRVRVVCVRERRGRTCAAASILVDAVLPELPPGAPLSRLRDAAACRERGQLSSFKP